MKYLLIISLFLASCSNHDSNFDVLPNESDSAIIESKKLNDSTKIVLDLADKKTTKTLEKVIKKVDNLQNLNISLRNENLSLKETIKVTKSTIVRDTIFITEKKNFWGKTKTKIDSSQSVVEDSTIIKN